MHRELQELLNTLELDYFPTKEELKKHFKNLIKKYHPDISYLSDAHENTLRIMNAYHFFLSNYHTFLEEYLHHFHSWKPKKTQITQNPQPSEFKIQIYTYKDILLGLPLSGIKAFVSKDQTRIFFNSNHAYLRFDGKDYLIKEAGENRTRLQYQDPYCIVLYEKPEFFCFFLWEKIKFVETLDMEPSNITLYWNGNYGILEHKQRKIYIPAVFRDYHFQDKDGK